MGGMFDHGGGKKRNPLRPWEKGDGGDRAQRFAAGLGNWQAEKERLKKRAGGGVAHLAIALPETPQMAADARADQEKILSFLGELDNVLAETYNIADALTLKDSADALRFLTDKLDLDQSVKNRATESQIRTQVKLGQLLAEMPKQRGARPADPSRGNLPATYDQLGIEKTAAHRWQMLARVDPAKLDRFINEAKENDRELTTGGAVAYAKNVIKFGVHFSSDSDDWTSPAWVVTAAEALMGGIDLDPCASASLPENVPAPYRFVGGQIDGLSRSWGMWDLSAEHRGTRLYLNPPYGTALPNWVDKFILEWLEGRISKAVLLLPARTDTAWFRELRDFPKCFISGRVHFGQASDPAPFPSVVVAAGVDPGDFVQAFGQYGDIYARINP